MGSIAKMVAKLVHGASRVMVTVAMLAMLSVMLLVVYNVALRETNAPPFRGIVEYVEFGMVLTAFLAIAQTEKLGQHVSVDELLDRVKGASYLVLRVFSGMAAAGITLMLAWASWDVLSDSIQRGEFKMGLVQIPMWPARLAVFIGFGLLALELVISTVEDVVSRVGLGADGATHGGDDRPYSER